jgi:hypothetical protein
MNNKQQIKPETSTPSWFLSHWRGETSLGISYWLNGILLATLLPTLILIAYSLIDPLRHSLRANALVVLILIVLRLGLWIWTIVGVTRSANRHTSRGGKPFWANAARVMICIAVVATLINAKRSLIPEMRVLTAMAIGHDPMDTVNVEAAADGRTIMLDGTLGQGSIHKLQKIIDASPGATTLVLNSDGGRAAIAEELALRIRQRHLNTFVEDHCLSACTYLFLAGIKRELAEDADLGFHQPTAEGLGSGDEELIQEMVAYYRSIGLREWFIDRIVATPPEDMWYPTRRELKDGGIITVDPVIRAESSMPVSND